MASESESDPEPEAYRPPNLALIRTELANERTLLAYGRSSLMLFATGVSLVKFLNLSFDFVILGWCLIAIGALVAMAGMMRFSKLRARLDATRER